MTMRIAVGLVLVTCLAGVAFGQWTALATNPSYWPYQDAATVPTIGTVNANYAGEPLGMVQGYWPTRLGSGVFANGKYYVACGRGNTYVEGAVTWGEERASNFAVYTPGANTWSSAKWDATGPAGYIGNTDLPFVSPYFGWIAYDAAMDAITAGSTCGGTAPNLFTVWDVKADSSSLRYQWKYDELGNHTLQGNITEVAIYHDTGAGFVKVKTLYSGPALQWLNDGRVSISGFWKSTDAEPLTPALTAALAAGNLYARVDTDDACAAGTGEVMGQLVANVNFTWGPSADRQPIAAFGNYCGTNSAQAFDRNGDGIKEFYIVGGYPHWDGTVSIYDPADNTWVPSAHLITTATSLYRVATALHNGKIYVTGGAYGNKLAIYDIATDRWSLGNQLLVTSVDRAASGVIGNTWYILGGGTTKIFSFDLSADPVTTDLVDTGESLPYAPQYATGGVYNNKIYIVGGTDSNAAGAMTKAAYVFDPAGTPGSKVTNLNKDFPFIFGLAASAIDTSTGKWYVGGSLQKRNAGNTADIVSSELYVLNLAPAGKKGDMNCDGVVDFKDINPFVAILSGSTPCNAFNADTNCDNAIDFKDINPFVALLSGGAPCAN